MPEKNVLQRERSKFVTVLAWVFIVFCGFASVIGLMQNIMLFFYQTEELNQELVEHLGAEYLPEFAKLVFENFQLLAFAIFLTSLVTFISAVGLLKRKNWARIAFIVLMSLGIIWGLFVFAAQFVIFDSTMIPADLQELPDLQSMIYIFQAFSLIIFVTSIALTACIIRKLLSAEVRAEFA